MIPTELIRKFAPWLLVSVAVFLASAFVSFNAYLHGVSVTNAEWQSRWDAQALELSEAKTKAVTLAREEEQRRQVEIDKVTQDAEKQIARAEADATAADAAAHSLREQAKRLAARASQRAGNSSVAQRGEATPSPGVVLSDLLGRADERAGELAAAYDRARASGLACERAYESLSSVRSGK